MNGQIILYLAISLCLIDSSIQDLNKRPVLSGLGDLDFSFLKTPTRRPSSLGGDENLCHCSGTKPKSVHTVKYHGPPDQKLVLCMCENAVMNAHYMIDTMGKVPHVIRQNNKAMLSAMEGKCGGAGSNGDVSYYCGKNMHVSVFIHESAHSFDKGKSASSEWHNAVAKDSCVPDPYGNTNYADNFAQVVVLWVHLVGKGRDKNFGGDQFACMKNQLKLMAKYLPAATIKN